MNPISPEIKTGTLGEILVQIRLLQYNVQANSPLKDSGNDLIAIKGNAFKSIQVKTTTNDTFTFDVGKLNQKEYHLLALVRLEGEDNNIFLDHSSIYLLRKDQVIKGRYRQDELDGYRLNQDLINELFDMQTN